MNGRRNKDVFPKMFSRGTPTDSSSVGYFFHTIVRPLLGFFQMELLHVEESCNKITVFYLKMVILAAKGKCCLLKYLTCKTTRLGTCLVLHRNED